MSYQERAEYSGVYRDDDSENIKSLWTYRGVEYTIDESSNIPTEMQHKNEQEGIDSFFEFVEETSEAEFDSNMQDLLNSFMWDPNDLLNSFMWGYNYDFEGKEIDQ